jgi:ABC-type uncharacterized transport system permease subunit
VDGGSASCNYNSELNSGLFFFSCWAPYIATMIVLAGFIGRARPPAAEGVPYEK